MAVTESDLYYKVRKHVLMLLRQMIWACVVEMLLILINLLSTWLIETKSLDKDLVSINLVDACKGTSYVLIGRNRWPNPQFQVLFQPRWAK